MCKTIIVDPQSLDPFFIHVALQKTAADQVLILYIVFLGYLQI
jgi:hypothetical protein